MACVMQQQFSFYEVTLEVDGRREIREVRIQPPYGIKCADAEVNQGSPRLRCQASPLPTFALAARRVAMTLRLIHTLESSRPEHRDAEPRKRSPRAFVDSDTARDRLTDRTPELQRLATAGAGDAGSSPAAKVDPGTPGPTGGAIPLVGANDTEPVYFVLFDEPRCERGWTLQYFENRRLADTFAAGRMLHGGPAKIVRVGP